MTRREGMDYQEWDCLYTEYTPGMAAAFVVALLMVVVILAFASPAGLVGLGAPIFGLWGMLTARPSGDGWEVG